MAMDWLLLDCALGPTATASVPVALAPVPDELAWKYFMLPCSWPRLTASVALTPLARPVMVPPLPALIVMLPNLGALEICSCSAPLVGSVIVLRLAPEKPVAPAVSNELVPPLTARVWFSVRVTAVPLFPAKLIGVCTAWTML